MSYYGTDQRGHLIPRAFTCVGCQLPIEMDQMTLSPTDGVAEDASEVEPLAWISPRRKGFIKPFFKTWLDGIGSPNWAIQRVPVGSSATRAYLYAILASALFATSGLVIVFAGFLIFGFALAGLGGRGFGMIVGLIASTVGGLVAFAVVQALFLFIWVGTAHLTLRLTGPVPHPMGRTAHAVCYSAGNTFLVGVPCFGGYLSPLAFIWWAITAGFMLAKAQAVSGVRAAVAIAALPVLIAVIAIGGALIVFFISSPPSRSANSGYSSPLDSFNTAAAAARLSAARIPARSSTSTFAPGSLKTIHDALIKYNNSAAGPLNSIDAAELIRRGHLDPIAMLAPGSGTTTRSAKYAGLTLDEWAVLKAPLPDHNSMGTWQEPQYRLGDFVIDSSSMPTTTKPINGLWHIVLWPDPATNRSPPPVVYVITWEGEPIEILAADFDSKLAWQNRLRSDNVLPVFAEPNSTEPAQPPIDPLDDQ